MPSVSFLGTAPGSVTAARFQSSILLEAGDTAVLLDAGEPCSQRLLELGFDLPELAEVWITHAHADHTAGLPLLLQAGWLRGRTAPLPVGIPQHLAAPLRAWLDGLLIPDAVLGYPVEIFSWQAGVSRALGGLSLIPHRTTHLARMQSKSANLEAFLFEILTPESRLIYSGDLGSPEDLRDILASPVDILICELAHFTPEMLAESLAGARIQTLCLTHLASEFDERRSEIQLLFESDLPNVDAVYLPDDGERIDF